MMSTLTAARSCRKVKIIWSRVKVKYVTCENLKSGPGHNSSAFWYQTKCEGNFVEWLKNIESSRSLDHWLRSNSIFYNKNMVLALAQVILVGLEPKFLLG